MGSETEAVPEGGGKSKPLPGSAWLFPKLLVWFGASAGALTAICTVFGYLVEHAYLDRLGVPRATYEATSREYIVTGAQFLASLVPLSLLGCPFFILDCWWVVLLAAALAIVAWRRRLSLGARFLMVSALYGAWLIAMIFRFEAVKAPDQEGLAVFAFGAMAAFLYCSCELFIAAQAGEGPGRVPDVIARLPLLALLICSTYALPILKGNHGTVREDVNVEFLGKDREVFCALAGMQPQVSDPDCGPWQLIEFGKERVLLRKAKDSNIYVVPAGSITTFRLKPSGSLR